jgi:uncharacterized protein YecT (DUF1311 family)
MMSNKLFLSLILLFVSNITYGQAPSCDGALSSVEYERCLQKKYEYVDKELNRVYQSALEKIENMEVVEHINFTEKVKKNWKEALRKAQREWIDFKEKECGKLVAYEHGGGAV